MIATLLEVVPMSRFASVLLLASLSATLIAQNPTATLVGTVRDQTGAIVVGANLEIRNKDTDIKRKAVANDRGEFTVPDLAPGPYDVTVTHAGFRTVREADIVLEMDQVARVDIKLEVGAVSQSVEVIESSAPLINTDNGTKGQVMTSQEIVEMPLNGRNINDLGFLVAGVTANTTNLQGSSFAINGARPDNTNFIIDGFNSREHLFGGALTSPNLDALQEFKMQTNNFSAEYGRMAGGVMNMVYKSGANQYHGVVFEFLRNNDTDARSFFDKSVAELRQNQFGATLSGPLSIPKVYNAKDRTFFLFSWESLREVTGSSAVGLVPTDAQKGGNFAGTPISDPLTTGTCPGSTGKGACFPNNVIPQSRLTSTSTTAQAYMPEPNQGGLNNLSSYVSSPNSFDSFVGKVDERLTEKDSVAFRITNRQSYLGSPYTNPLAVGSNNTGQFGAFANTHVAIAGLTYTRLFKPTLINELRIGYTRNNSQNKGNFAGTDYTSKFGLPVSTTDTGLIGFPTIGITNYQQIGPNNNFPIIYYTNSASLGDTFTWVNGAHLIKAGVDILHNQTVDPYANNVRGTYQFTGFWTGQPYADFLLGYLNSDSRLLAVNVNHFLSTSYGTFAQDDWKATSNLTLNLGLRWEVNKPPIDSADKLTNFIPGLNKEAIASLDSLSGTGVGFTNPSLVVTAKDAGLPRSLVYTSYRNFAPRFGFAWRPFGGNKTVIRGGYGIFFGGMIQNGIRTGLADGFPFAITQTGNRSATNPLQLDWASPFPNPTLVSNIASFALSGYELHPPSAYLQSWNFTIEREVGFSSALKISYVGSKGTHLGMQDNINQPYNRSAQNTAGILPYPGWGTINYFNFQDDSTYEGATLTWQRRFVHGFFFVSNYTYSKSIDASSLFNAMSLGGITGLQNSMCLSCDRGRSDWDVGHMFTNSFSWESHSRSLFLRGWQMAGTTRLSTGNPFTPVNGTFNAALGEANRPNRLGKGTVPNPTPNNWFNVADFPLVPDGSFAFGNSGRNILDGPGNISVNLTVYKNFTIREKTHLQFRWEVFNVLNHANFQLPINNVVAPNAGTLTSVVSPGRQIQFGARYSF
jgi:outer membrane receptor protein involved in Fe transport